VANVFRTISTKFYQNRPGFVDDVTGNYELSVHAIANIYLCISNIGIWEFLH